MLKTIKPGKIKITKSSESCYTCGAWTICHGNKIKEMKDFLEQSFTACMPLLVATGIFGLGR